MAADDVVRDARAGAGVVIAAAGTVVVPLDIEDPAIRVPARRVVRARRERRRRVCLGTRVGYRSQQERRQEASVMGIGISIFLLAVGAILTFAIEVTTEGVDLDTVGVILMVVGAVGLLMSMLFWSSWAPFTAGHGHTETYVRDDRRL